MTKALALLLLACAPLVAVETPVKPQVVIEGVTVQESDSEQQYNLQSKITSMLFSLGAVIVSVMIVTFVLKKLARKRLSAANSGSSIKIVEKRSLTPKTALYVVEAYNKTLLIGESPAGLVALGDLDHPPAEVSNEPAPLSFTQILKRKFKDLKP